MHVPDLIILNSSKMIDILFLFLYAVIVWVNFFFYLQLSFSMDSLCTAAWMQGPCESPRLPHMRDTEKGWLSCLS